MGRQSPAGQRHRRSAFLGAPILVLIALAGAGWAPVAAAARAPAPGTSEELLDCAVEDVEADPRHGFDDRCEMWTAVYDDSEHYDNSLSTYATEPAARDDVIQVAVSRTGDRVFTLSRSCRDTFPPQCRWGVVANRASTGDELWVAHAPGVVLVDLVVSGDGARVYATGNVEVRRRVGDGDPLLNTDALTIAWDAATGQKLWERTFRADPVGHREGDPHDLHSVVFGAAVAADPARDRIYVTGHSDNRDESFNLIVIAYEGATGARRWVAAFDSSTQDRPYVGDGALPQLAEVSPDGTTLYLAGLTGSSPRLLAYQAHDPRDPAGDGTLLWVTDDLSGTPQSLDLAPDGSRIYLLESPNRIGSYEAATGVRAWPVRPRYHGGEGTPADLAVSAGGDLVVVTGGIPGEDDTGDYGTVAYGAATGQQAWVARYDGWSPEGGRDDAATAVGVSPDGARVYATGVSVDGDSDQVFGRQVTVAYDSGGQQQWAATYSRSFDTEAGQLLTVGPDGTVFTTGVLEPMRAAGYPTKNVADWGVQAYEP